MSERVRLPPWRPIITSRLRDRATGDWHLTCGFDPAGQVREIFLDAVGHAGSALDALIHDVCILLSRDALQRGCSARDLVRKLSDRPPSLLAAALSLAAELEDECRAQARLISDSERIEPWHVAAPDQPPAGRLSTPTSTI